MKIEDLKPGDVLLCCPDQHSWIGKAIVLITKGKVSHAAIYVGGENGKPQIAHSEAHGIVYMPFEEFTVHEPAGFYVMRHNEQTDLQPVLNAVEKYINEKIPYPYANLGLLGLLILLNRFSKDTIKSRIFYRFASLVAIKLMKKIRDVARHGKATMICSQFAAQCYTDAGTDYDIKFNKLLLQFGEAKNSAMEMSLFDLLRSGNESEIDLLDDSESNEILAQEEQIAHDFIQLMEGAEDLSLTNDEVTENKLSGVSADIVMSLCYLLTGEEPKSVEHASQIIGEFSTNRNFFVTPDDLLSNTKNLDEKGFFDSAKR